MAGNSVGTIVIDAKLQSQEVKMGSRELQAAVKNLQTTVQRTGRSLNSAATGYGTAMRKSVQASREVTASMREIGNQATALKAKLDSLRNAKVATDEFKKVVTDIQKVKKAAEETENKINLLYSKGYASDDPFVVSLIKAAEKYENELDFLAQKRDQMLAKGEGTAYVKGENTAEYKNAQSVYDWLRQRYAELEELKNQAFKPPYLQQWEQMPRLTSMIGEGFGRIQNAAAGAANAIMHPAQSLDRLFGSVVKGVSSAVGSLASMAGSAAQKLAKMAGNAALSYLRKLASEARNAAVQLARLAANAVSSGLKKIGSVAVSAGKALVGFNKQTKRSNSGLKTSLKTILKYAFGVRSMFFLFRRLRTAVKDAFKELAKQNPEVKASITSLSKALSGLKGSLATAFAPILTAIAPALTRLINMLTAAMNTIGAFLAALRGASTVSISIGGGVGGAAKNAANSVNAIGNAADVSNDKLDKVGKTGEKMAKKVKKAAKDAKRQLLGFDELNVLQDNSGGGGGGGGGGGISFKTVPIESRLKEFADKLRELWKSGAFEEIGIVLAGAINDAIGKAKELITFDNLMAVQKAIDAITGIFNGLIDPEKGIDFELIGQTIAEGANTITQSLSLLFDKIKSYNIGVAVAGLLNGFFQKREVFQSIGTLITKWITMKLDIAQGFVDKIDEGSIASAILAAISGIGWESIATSAWNVIQTAFSKTGNFLNILLGGNERPKILPDTPQIRALAQGGGLSDQIVQVYGQEDYTGVWDEVAENFTKGFNQFVTDATAFISGLEPTEVIDAVIEWIGKIGDGINFDSLGDLIGTGIQKAFDIVGPIIANFHKTAGAKGRTIATALQTMIHSAFSGENNPATIFSDAVIGAFDFVKAFLEGFDPEQAANDLIDAVNDIKWGEIAQAAWDAFETAVSKLGNFLTVLFGGSVEPVLPDTPQVREAAQSGQLDNRYVQQYNDTNEKGFTDVIGKTVSAALAQLDKWIADIDFESIGTKIHNVLENLPWADWGDKLAQGLRDLLSGIDDLIFSSIFGEDYKENDLWRTMHPYKASQYDLEKAGGQSQNLAKVLDEFGMTAEDFTRQLTASDVLSTDPNAAQQMKDAQAIVDQILERANYLDAVDYTKEAGLILKDAADTAQKDIDEAWERFAANENPNPEIYESGNETYYAGTGQSAAEMFEAAADGIVDSLADNAKATESNTDAINKKAPENAGVEDRRDLFTKMFDDLGDLIFGRAHAEEAKQPMGEPLPAQEFDWSGWNEAWNAYGERTSEQVDLSGKQVKETKRLTKEMKKNTKKRAEATVGIDFSGSGLDLEGDQPTVKAGVKFVPEGQDDDEEEPKGLLDWLQALLDPGVTVEEKVALIKEGWDSLITWIFGGDNPDNPISAFIGLVQSGWTALKKWLFGGDGGDSKSSPLSTFIDLVLAGWNSLREFLGIKEGSPIDTAIKLLLSGAKSLFSFLGLGIDGNTPVKTFVDLAMKTWKNIRDFLGIPEGSPLDVLIQAILNSWPGILKALGLPEDATIKTVLSVALQALENLFDVLGIPKDSALRLLLNLAKGLFDDDAEKALNSNGNEFTTKENLQKGSGFEGEAQKALNAEDQQATTSINLKQGDNWAQGLQSWFDQFVHNPVQFAAEIKNNASEWWSNVQTWFDEKKKTGTFEVNPKNESNSWINNVIEWFNGKKKNGSFDVEPQNESASWIDSVKKWFDDKAKWGKNKGGFNVKANNDSPTWASNVLSWFNKKRQTASFKVKPENNASSWWENVKSWWNGVKQTLGFKVAASGSFAAGGYVTNSGRVGRFASGGAIMNNGRASWWDSVQKYASGTSMAHGTVFVAGEAGPEIMGHVNGKTEILNKSQLAEAIYGAVVSGMAQAVNALGVYLANRMSTCTNAVISTISSGISMIEGLNYYAPTMASGTVMPYDVSAQIARSANDIQNTLNNNNEDLIQAMVSAIGNAASSIVTVLQRQQMSASGNNMTSRQMIDELNRMTYMFGATPLKGV